MNELILTEKQAFRDPPAAGTAGSRFRLHRQALGAAAAIAVALMLAGCGPPLGIVEHRVPGNLLSPETPVESWGAIREQRLVDGRIPPPGAPSSDFVASLFLVPGARVTFDLGRPTRIDAVRLFSDDTAHGCLAWSLNGVRFAPIRLTPPAGRGPIRSRHATDLGLTARYLRLQPTPDLGGKAFAELLAFEETTGFQTRRPAHCDPPTRAEAIRDLRDRVRFLDRVKVGIALLALVLLMLARRLSRPGRTVVAGVVLLAGIAAVGRFGWFHGNGWIVHPGDAMHYYLGAKYFDELGQRELYRAIAAHERERGRGFMLDRDRVWVRNLDDNAIHPGSWTATPDGASRATFTPERWSAFGRDVDFFRRLFVYRDFHKALGDHGYNATPFHTAWLGAATNAVPAGRRSMLAWAGMDMLAYVAALAAILWAFGPAAAAVAALVFGLGAPWSFSWTGGSIGRTAWLAVLCWGWALIRRRHTLTGMAILTGSALLRLFPVVFVAAVGLFALIRRRDEAEGGRAEFLRVAGTVAVTIALGVGIVWLTHGLGVFGAFREKVGLHASVPPGNHLGLRALVFREAPGSLADVAGGSGAADPTGVDLPPRPARLLVWGLGIALSLILLVRRAREGAQLWEAVPYAAPLLFASIPLSGYDYAWLAVLAPLAAASSTRLALLIGLAAATIVLDQLLVGLRPTYLAYNATVAGVLIAFFWPWGWPWLKSRARGRPPRPRSA